MCDFKGLSVAEISVEIIIIDLFIVHFQMLLNLYAEISIGSLKHVYNLYCENKKKILINTAHSLPMSAWISFALHQHNNHGQLDHQHN